MQTMITRHDPDLHRFRTTIYTDIHTDRNMTLFAQPHVYNMRIFQYYECENYFPRMHISLLLDCSVIN
jgi:hypothetical protein